MSFLKTVDARYKVIAELNTYWDVFAKYKFDLIPSEENRKNFWRATRRGTKDDIGGAAIEVLGTGEDRISSVRVGNRSYEPKAYKTSPEKLDAILTKLLKEKDKESDTGLEQKATNRNYTDIMLKDIVPKFTRAIRLGGTDVSSWEISGWGTKNEVEFKMPAFKHFTVMAVVGIDRLFSVNVEGHLKLYAADGDDAYALIEDLMVLEQYAKKPKI